MRRLFVVTLILTVTVVFASPGDARTRRVSIPDPMDSVYQVATYQAVAGQQYVAQLQAEQYVEMLVEYLESIPTVPVAADGQQALRGAAGSIPASGGGCCTQAQFEALARCESGTSLSDPSPWRTGYFGIEAGYAIGGLSLAEQEAWVERIYAQYGARAWGCSAAFR